MQTLQNKPQTIGKTISFGNVAYYGTAKRNEITVSIELRFKEHAKHWETLNEVSNVPELSICGALWNSSHTDHEMGGQCIDELYEMLPNNQKLKRIKEIWEQYHLNDLKAGTKKQTEYLEALKNEGWKYEYGPACEQLRAANLYEDNGYKYGHGWLYQPIPEDILQEIKDIINS